MKRFTLTAALLAVLSGGALYAHYITTLVNSSESAATACSTSAVFDCTKNLHSEYGKLHGVPVTVLATALFALLAFHLVLTQFQKPSSDQKTNQRAIFALPLFCGYAAGAVDGTRAA